MGAAVPAKCTVAKGAARGVLYTAALNPFGGSARLGGFLFYTTAVVCHFLPLVRTVE